MTPHDPMITVWEFISPSSGERTKVARLAEPDDLRVQHEYQRVIWRGWQSERPRTV